MHRFGLVLSSQILLFAPVNEHIIRLTISYNYNAVRWDSFEHRLVPATHPFKDSNIETVLTQTTARLNININTPQLQVGPVEVQAKVNKIEKNMMMFMQKTNDLLKVIKKRLVVTLGESRAEECLKTYIEVYEEAIDDIKNSVDDFKAGNYYKKMGRAHSSVGENIEDNVGRRYLQIVFVRLNTLRIRSPM
ncbi:hypothetical protein LguiB_030393 [Lonicera macranthoides]